MAGRIIMSITAAFMTLFLSGCLKETPKCSDRETFSIARNIILNQIGGAGNLSEPELEENLKFEYPRANAYDEKIKKYSCEAKLIVAGAYQLPIKYESQLDDNNQHIVSIGGIMRGDLWNMAGHLQSAKAEKAKKAKQLTTITPSPPPEKPVEASKSSPAQNPEPAHDEVNYCLTEEARKQLSQAERSFIQKQLKSREVDVKDASVQFNTKEIADSMGGPEFKCAGKVTVISKSTNVQVLSYDIGYDVFMDEGLVGIDPKKISRTNILPPVISATPASTVNKEKRTSPASSDKDRRIPAANSQKPATNENVSKKDKPKNIFDVLKSLPKGEPSKDDAWKN